MYTKPTRIQHKQATRHFSTNRQSTFCGIMALTAILSTFLLFFTNTQMQKQVYLSYCGDFGFYGKSLTLMKTNTFAFIYHGCSQTAGHFNGTWSIEDSILILDTASGKDLLQSRYKIQGNDLIPLTEEENKFTLCEVYVDPFLTI